MGVVAIYCRISKDRAGRAESVADQERRGRAYAAERWPDLPVEVYVDNDLSAADPDTNRPGYEALRDAVRRGQVTHLWVVEQTRLERTEIGWFELAAELVAAGIDEVHTDRDGILRVGDEVASIKAVLAAAEVRRLRARVRAKHASLAAQGRPHGGNDFGYRPGRDADGRATLEVEPGEAEMIRWAADSILAGWSLAAVAREFNARGVPLARGGAKGWTGNQIRRIVTKPSVAGFRVHHGEIIGRATWEPILDETTWRQVRAELDTRSHARGTDGRKHPVGRTRRPPRRYLLTGGISVCGLCEAPLVGQQRRWKNSPLVPYYMCHPSKQGCLRIGILGEPFEAHVVDRLLDRLDSPGFAAAMAADDHQARRDDLARALAAIDRQQVELADRWAAGSLPTQAWDTARARLEEERARLAGELAEIPAPVATVDLGELREDWDWMALEEQRHVVRLLIERVVVAPAVPGRRFDAGRITIHWRADAGSGR